jgi:hypothetical protein
LERTQGIIATAEAEATSNIDRLREAGLPNVSSDRFQKNMATYEHHTALDGFIGKKNRRPCHR